MGNVHLGEHFVSKSALLRLGGRMWSFRLVKNRNCCFELRSRQTLIDPISTM